MSPDRSQPVNQTYLLLLCPIIVFLLKYLYFSCISTEIIVFQIFKFVFHLFCVNYWCNLYKECVKANQCIQRERLSGANDCTIGGVGQAGLGKIELDANIGSLAGHSPRKYYWICIFTVFVFQFD